MGKYQSYEKYKDSGVEWLGKIPEHWKCGVKLLQLAEEKQHSFVNGPFGSDLLTSELQDDGIPVIYSGDIKSTKFCRKSDKYVTEEKAIQLNFCRVDPGDLLLAKVGDPPGDAAIYPYSENSGIVTQDVVRIKVDRTKATPEYLSFFINSQTGKFIIKLISIEATRSRFSLGDFKGIRLFIPPLDEQKAIARFLDHKTKQIDDLIAKKEALLEKLDEKRTALISHAVTKGLDPNVPMKDSGIEWLGKIPEHWKVVAIKRCFDIRDGTHDTPQYVQEGEGAVPLITSKDFENESINFQQAKYISISDHQEISKRSRVDYGDVLMSMIGGNIGKSLIVKTSQEFSIKNVALFKANNDLELSKLLLFYLSSGLLDIQISLKNRGGAQGFLSLTDIRNLVFLKIPKSERKTIVNYLDCKTDSINQQKAKIQEAIDRLKEYRTSFITNAVTGKIDVRQVPIP